jgi:putative glutamine amidotransferase
MPLIGLTTYREEARWAVWAQRADVLHVDYADAVVRAGAVPVLLPPAPAGAGDDTGELGPGARAAASAEAVVARLDGLVVTGGADVDPRLYGEQPHPRTGAPREDRDAWELALLDAAERAGLPTLAVCRGMQLMVVAAGGTLHQHLPEVVGNAEHAPDAGVFGDRVVTTHPGSLVHRIEGDRIEVHCHHHQGVRTHPGFVVTATAEDGCVEALEAPVRDRFALGVQWHPEINRDQRLFDALVQAATPGR